VSRDHEFADFPLKRKRIGPASFLVWQKGRKYDIVQLCSWDHGGSQHALRSGAGLNSRAVRFSTELFSPLSSYHLASRFNLYQRKTWPL
jgi:hypothetical protein